MYFDSPFLKVFHSCERENQSIPLVGAEVICVPLTLAWTFTFHRSLFSVAHVYFIRSTKRNPTARAWDFIRPRTVEETQTVPGLSLLFRTKVHLMEAQNP